MLDIAAFVVCVLLAALLLRPLARRLRPAGAFRGASWALALLAALVLVGTGSWRLANARTFQLMGEIVPRVETRDSVVALTFDDGPTPEATRRVLAMLGEEGIAATFFLIGKEINEHPEAAREIVAAGHEVGNHSYTHPILIGRSLAGIAEELGWTDDRIQRAGYRGPVHFRSPYGKKYVALPYHLSRTGRKNIFFDVEPESHPGIDGNAARIVEHVVERTRPGSIILLHVMYPSREASLAAVPGIIRRLQSRGYRFVTVSQLLRAGESSPDARGR